MLTFALLGGAVGAGVAIAKTTNASVDTPAEDETTAMKTVGGAALAGAFFGLLLDRRARRHAQKVARGAKVAAAVAGVAKAARPKLEQAIEVSRPRLEHAAGATREAALVAAEAARTRLSKAA